MKTLLDSTVLKGVFGTVLTLSLEQWSSVASILAGFATAGYVIYKWVRDVRARRANQEWVLPKGKDGT